MLALEKEYLTLGVKITIAFLKLNNFINMYYLYLNIKNRYFTALNPTPTLTYPLPDNKKNMQRANRTQPQGCIKIYTITV